MVQSCKERAHDRDNHRSYGVVTLDGFNLRLVVMRPVDRNKRTRTSPVRGSYSIDATASLFETDVAFYGGHER